MLLTMAVASRRCGHKPGSMKKIKDQRDRNQALDRRISPTELVFAIDICLKSTGH